MKTLFLFLFTFFGCMAFSQKTDSIKPSPKELIGQVMPEIADSSISGKFWSSEELKGKVVLINFWYIACAPCMTEISYLNSLKEKYKEEDFVLLSIAPHTKQDLLDFNSDSASIFSAIRKYMAKTKIEFEVIAECNERTRTNDSTIAPDCNRISGKYNVQGFPCTFIINQNGIVEFVSSGFARMPSANSKYKAPYEKEIERLLALKK